MMNKLMQRGIYPYLIASCLALLLLAIAIATQPSDQWIYTTYSNGITSLAVAETTTEQQFYSLYETQEKDTFIRGRLNITNIRRDQAYTYISGLFSDTNACTGRISIRRPNPQSGQPIVAEVSWVVTQEPVNIDLVPINQTCQVPKGHRLQLNLPEALPIADNRGNFTNDNSNTFLSEAGFFTWTQWQVSSANGALNCQDQPNGSIKQTYRPGQIISKLGLEMLEDRNLVELADGSSWLKTREKCFVRASDRLIKPLSLPTNFW